MSLEYLNKCILEKRIPDFSKFENHQIYLIRFLLEAQFSPRKFSIEEIKELLKQSLPFGSLEEEGNQLIPEWYKKKYF